MILACIAARAGPRCDFAVCAHPFPTFTARLLVACFPPVIRLRIKVRVCSAREACTRCSGGIRGYVGPRLARGLCLARRLVVAGYILVLVRAATCAVPVLARVADKRFRKTASLLRQAARDIKPVRQLCRLVFTFWARLARAKHGGVANKVLPGTALLLRRAGCIPMPFGCIVCN